MRQSTKDTQREREREAQRGTCTRILYEKLPQSIFEEVQWQSTGAVLPSIGIRREQADEEPREVHVHVAATKLALRLVVIDQVSAPYNIYVTFLCRICM